MKRGILTAFIALSVLLIPAASAFSFVGLLDSIEIQFVLAFLFFFSIVYFALKKIIFGEEQMIAGIVSGIMSFFMAKVLSVHLQTFLAEYDFAKYVFLAAVVLSLILITKLLFRLGTIKLKWLAVVTFVIYCAFRFINWIPLQNFKNSLPPTVLNIVDVIGVVTALITIFSIFKLIKTIPTPVEREEARKIKREKAEERRKIAEERAAGKKAEAERAETGRLQEERQKEANFQERVRQRYLKKLQRAKEGPERRNVPRLGEK